GRLWRRDSAGNRAGDENQLLDRGALHHYRPAGNQRPPQDLDGRRHAGTRRPRQADGARHHEGHQGSDQFLRRGRSREPRCVMGKQPRDRVGWLAEKAAHLLDPAEREVVCGDLVETGVSDTRALVEILGLVVRRQMSQWTTWQPWAALILVVAPLGMVLSLIARLWADAVS